MQEPAKKHNELLDQLDALINEPNDFTLRRIEREATQLLKSDAAYAYMVLGVAASQRADSSKIDEFFAKAIALSSDPVIAANYAIALGRVGRYDEALDKIDAQPSLSNNPSLLRDGLSFIVFNGDYERGFAYCERLDKLKTEAEEDSDLSSSRAFFNLMAQSGLPSQQVKTYHGLANHVLHEFDLFIGKQVLNIWANDSWLEDQPSIVYDIYVNSTQVAEMEWRLAELLADSEDQALRSGSYSIHFHQLKSQ